MPGHSTIAEREAELAALQSAFDEYIASSRELEDELDAELAKMQEKLAESSAANAALSAQLENIAPQLASLEKALSESRFKLKEEQKLRRLAEQSQDDAEARYREAEASLITLREECDAVHEELAFKETELEETRLELEVESERLRQELEQARTDLSVANNRREEESTVVQSIGNSSDDAVARKIDTEADGFPAVDDAYVKKLEDELELVTEQLIETEQRLSTTEDKLNQSEVRKGEAEVKAQELNEAYEAVRKELEEQKDMFNMIQEENAQRLEEEHKLRADLELKSEELAMAQEDLKAAEEDAKTFEKKMDDSRATNRDEVVKLQNQLRDIQTGEKAATKEVGMLEQALNDATKETAKLKDEAANMNRALSNLKKDNAALEEELLSVNQRFDEVRNEAQKVGRELAAEEVRAAMKEEREAELQDLRDQLKKISEENSKLQDKMDEAELAIATAKDLQDRNQLGTEVQSETVKELQSQLTRSKEELAKKDREMSVLVSGLETRFAKAEDTVRQLEKDLSSTKAKLAETEANLIVSRRTMVSAATIPKQASTDSAEGASSVGVSSLTESRQSRAESPETKARRARSTSPSSNQRAERRLQEDVEKIKELQKLTDDLKEQKRLSDAHVKKLEENLQVLKKQVMASSGDAGVVTQMTRLSTLGKEKSDVLIEDNEGKSKIQEIIDSGDSGLMTEELMNLDKKFAAQREYNAQLLSKMLSLQGNIQVYCRIRPMSIPEVQKGYKAVAEALSETEVGCYDSRANKWKSFGFDRVWGPDQSQQSIFQDVEPLALSVVDGFNACIFAYGQTGSGKTYTMEGVQQGNQYGISYRTIQKIFQLLSIRAHQQKTASIMMMNDEDETTTPENFNFSIRIGMLEIYNDEVFDLLASSGSSMADKKKEALKAGGKASLEVRRTKEGRMEVPNMTREDVNSIEDVMELLKRGNANRATAATDLNLHSSRSHMILWVDVSSGLDGQPGNSGTLFLVDLAGSERVRKSNVEGDQLKEAAHINKSLSALGNVMEALDRKAAHVPYRDSKLTFLLQDSLGGNSRTMMIVTVCPMDVTYDESVHALQFATRVRRIQLGAAQRNVTSKNLEETVKTLTAEMKALTMQKERTESQLHSLKRDNGRIQDKLQKLSDARSKSQSDTKTLEVLRKNNNEMANRWQKEKKAREETAEELEKARKELRKVQQQLTKTTRDYETQSRKLEDKEKQLENASRELRDAKDASSAAAVRARRAQVLGARSRTAHVASTPRTPTSTSTTPTADGPATPGADTAASEEEPDIRSKVLELLEKHDKGKVNRIDIIMEKFKGKEALLLEKMTQRYEGTTGDSSSVSFQKRNEMAMERHKERMRKKLEQQKANSSS